MLCSLGVDFFRSMPSISPRFVHRLQVVLLLVLLEHVYPPVVYLKEPGALYEVRERVRRKENIISSSWAMAMRLEFVTFKDS